MTLDQIKEEMKWAYAIRDMSRFNRLKIIKSMLELQQILKEMK